MNIKKIIKISFSVISLLVFFIATINIIVLYQIKDNSNSQISISKLVFLEEGMNSLVKDLININTHKQLETIKDKFKVFENNFEKVKDSFENENEDFIDIFLIDMHNNSNISDKLSILYKNEKSIEKYFDKLYLLQKEKIMLMDKFNLEYPLENKLRKKIELKILDTKDINLVQNFGKLKYYSKEALFQHKNKKYFNKWINQIEVLSTEYELKDWYKYEKIVEELSIVILRTEVIKKLDVELSEKIVEIITLNRVLNQSIKNSVDSLSTNFINYIYIILLILSVFTIGFISIVGYKVHKNIGLSVDEIENKVQNGLKTINDLNDEMEITQKEVVFTMGAIGESRSKETGNHVKRVAEYSKILALYYGLSEKDAEMLKQASPMHDIGKVAIPDSVLNKPGRFNEEEREIMDTHASLGYEMLKYSNRPLLKMAATVAYEHHEKYDGTGYPQGTKGENIHIYGRITALADVFDALGSDRVYKKAWDDEKIFKLLKEERGKHFDPKLIDIFFKNINDFLAIRDKFKEDIA